MNYLIYGANGYTGRLIAEEAKKRGHMPLLCGRGEATRTLARTLNFPSRIFSLEAPDALRSGLQDVALVLNCAGPFSRTAKRIVDACIDLGVHYLDITGEIAVFEMLAQEDARARAAGITLLPGVGFDVVPSDCLALHVKNRLPTATQLRLAFRALSTVSNGTAKTIVEHMGEGGYVRKNGALVPVELGESRSFDFGDGPRTCLRIPWGDLATAHRSTGIGNVETYMRAPAWMQQLAKLASAAAPLLRAHAVQSTIERLIDIRAVGKDDTARRDNHAMLVAEAEDERGEVVRSRLRTPEAYQLTASTALDAVERVLADGGAGYFTPAQRFGADFILQVPGVERVDL